MIVQKCQYCETFIADDVPSRTQHESGLRHKGNKERYIRNLYKTGIKKKQDLEEEKVAMKFVEAAAQAAFAKDVSSGSARASQSEVTTSKPAKPPPKPADPFSNYTTAASLGITDPDADLKAVEQLKKSEGVAGEWVAVVPPPPPLPTGVNQTASSSTEQIKSEVDVEAGQIRKREEGPVDEEDSRRFKLRKKTVAVGLGEIYDPGIITVKARANNTPKTEDGEIINTNPNGNSTPPSLLVGSVKPVWVSRSWKKAGEPLSLTSPEESKVKIESDSTDTLKTSFEPHVEGKEAIINDQMVGVVKKEEEQEIPLPEPQPQISNVGLFRKRKVPTSSSGKRKDR